MSEFLFALTKNDLADGGKQLIEINDQLVLIFRIGEQFFCMDDVCTHDGGTLANGENHGFEIACPRHGARFDVRTGRPLCMPATQPVPIHECRVDGDRIFVKI